MRDVLAGVRVLRTERGRDEVDGVGARERGERSEFFCGAYRFEGDICECSFAAAFKRHHGVAPGRWRATARAAA